MKYRSPLPVRKFRRAFTLVEMLVVMVIIAILAGLILSGAGYAQKTAAKKRAASEIVAMEAALESYKGDNGIYPQTDVTDDLDPRAKGDPITYKTASLTLYRALSGDRNLDRKVTDEDGELDIDGSSLSPPPSPSTAPKQYMEFNPNMLEPSGGTDTVTALLDPFGSSYGYSTAFQTSSSKGYNPTFDLWSTSGKTATADSPQWITNW